MLTRVLSDKQDALLREERALLMRLRTALARIDAADDQQQALDESIAQLDELFLLVVVGEFNAGKSAFINALIGQPLMREGVTPTTAVITVLEHGEQPEQTVRQANLLVIKAPIVADQRYQLSLDYVGTPVPAPAPTTPWRLEIVHR